MSAKSASDFFARKKKKTAVKAANLNEDGAPAPAAAPKKEKKDASWKEDVVPEAEAVSPKTRGVQNLADIQEDEEDKKAVTWGSAPKSSGAPQQGGSYQPPGSGRHPGQLSERSFPDLGKGVNHAIEVGQKRAPSRLGGKFEGLKVGGDSDEEDGGPLPSALVSKQKGAKIQTKEEESSSRKDVEEESEFQRKEREEKERKKKEREEEKKAEKEKKAKEDEEKMKKKTRSRRKRKGTCRQM